jgi:CRP-like cAMP-binding protein
MTGNLYEYRLFMEGETIFREGERGGEAFLIKSGEVELARQTPQGPRIIGRNGPNSLFGEMAVISDMPRIATATAVGETLCYAISRRVFMGLLEKADSDVQVMIHTLADFIRDAREGTFSPGGKDRRPMIVRHLLVDPGTHDRIARLEPVMAVLCRGLIDYARAVLKEMRKQ